MAVQIRPAEQEELGEFDRIVALSLAMQPGATLGMRPEWTLCAFEDDRLATCYAAWPFTMRFNGTPVPVHAVTTVSTLPVYRRRGHLRAIMEADFRRLHETDGPAIAILYASLAAIYQRFGYAVVTTHYSYRVEPRYLSFAYRVPTRGVLRELSREQSGVLNEILKRYREPRNGFLHRSRAVWELGALAPPPAGHALNLLVYEEDGEPLGYAVYTTGPGAHAGPGPSHALQIRDLACLTPAAYAALWDAFARYDLVREITWSPVPEDDPLPHLLHEPRMLNRTSRDGILARLVDVPRALAQRPYAAAASLTFALTDETAPWNAGRWRLETSGAETRVTRTDAEPQIALPVTTLAMLAFGQLSATEAARMGRLDAHEPTALDTWDAVLRPRYRPFCAEHF